MMMLISEVLHVFEEAKGFRMFEVGHSFEGSVGNGLEVSVSSEGRVVHVRFLVVVSGSEDFVIVTWFIFLYFYV